MYLFRFRDLVANTLAEHRAVIDAKGACWWGWWKRPSERARQDVWRDIAGNASMDHPVQILLFDSGHDCVYVATVVQAIAPSDDGATAPVPVPAGEEELIPEYYRDSPYSRAWLKLIGDFSGTDFFRHWSFAEAPALPNYQAATLNDFVGKVVMSGDELRSMDTTIWAVRAREPDDSERIVLLSGAAGPALPLSAQPVECQGDSILHISDLHFGVGTNRGQHIWRLEGEAGETMSDSITRAVEGKRVGLVIVTGDLTCIGAVGEFSQALHSLRRLLGNLNLGPEHLVVVPGNHDIQWSVGDRYTEDSPVTAAPEDAKRNYRDFYARLFRHEAHASLAMARRFLLPCGLTVEVIGLNSSALATGRDFLAGMGSVDEASLEEARHTLGWQKKLGLSFRVLALHHHLVLTDNVEAAPNYLRGFGIAIDAPRIQRKAADLGVQLALHGHKHRPFIWRSSVYELPELSHDDYYLGDLSVVGAGSAGSSDAPAGNNYFNVLTASAGALKLEIFRSERGRQFDQVTTWDAAFSIDRNALMLGRWLEHER